MNLIARNDRTSLQNSLSRILSFGVNEPLAYLGLVVFGAGDHLLDGHVDVSPPAFIHRTESTVAWIEMCSESVQVGHG